MAAKTKSNKKNSKSAAPKEAKREAPDKGEAKELSLEDELRAKLNIKTDYEKLPEGVERKSSFSDGAAVYRRGNRYYTEEEYQRTSARRAKLEARLAKQLERAESTAA